jgi:heavy metal efflux system protein
MINLLVSFAVERRWLVLLITLLIAAAGVYNMMNLSVDAVPDITNIQVQINTEALGYSTVEVEQRVTYTIETAMAGIPRLDYTRSLSRYGLSQVTVIFEEGTDIYWARQQVAERLQTVRGNIPSGLEPTLGPITSGLGEIVMYSVTADPDFVKPDGKKWTPQDLREVQDWIIRPQLMKVPGITEINTVGGYEREFQVKPDPGRLLAFKITINDLIEALEKNNRNVGAGFIERNGEQWIVRSPGQLANVEQIKQIVVTKRDDSPVRVRDVADVIYGSQLRTGAATRDGEEVVLGTAFMLLGENSRTVAKAVVNKLEEIGHSLPKGMILSNLYDRTILVDKTIETVKTNLLEGAVLVIAVLFALLGNIRAAILTAAVIPLSMLFAVTGMAANRVSGNLMSLGAIDFGLIVDGAVIVVENSLTRLAQTQQQLGRVLTFKERLQQVTNGTVEVFRPAVFGMLIIMLVYFPIFALTGVEGKMFHPMAFTVIAALCGALIFSVTFVPAAIAILIRGEIKSHDNRLMQMLRRFYTPILDGALKYPFTIVSASTLLVIACVWQATRMGSEFLPQLDEHDIALHALRIPGTSLTQAIDMQMQLEKVIRDFPEVAMVFAKIGTPEIATDPMPPNVADTFLILKPVSAWPNPSKSKQELLNELRTAVEEVPGNKYEFTQPIEMRFNELIAGVRSDVAIRIYGDDLDMLAKAAEQASTLLATIPGAQDVRYEQTKGLPLLSVEPQRDHLSLVGLSVEDIQRTLQYAISGVQAGIIYEGDKRFKLVVRLDDSVRADPDVLARLPVHLPDSADPDLVYVPLGEVATITETQGPNQINRESGKRNIVVTANVVERDLGSFINDTKEIMRSQLTLPTGYWLDYGGTFEQLESATQRLSIVVPITLLLIFALLFTLFNSFKDALIIFSAVPLALTGGVLALALRGMPLSISAAVGFIALSGIAVLNGVVMLSFISELRSEGEQLRAAIVQGAKQRLRPVLMTALVASLGFVPMALNTGTGAEVQRPLATVVIGGILSSTLLTLVVLPALYLLFHRIGWTSAGADTADY